MQFPFDILSEENCSYNTYNSVLMRNSLHRVTAGKLLSVHQLQEIACAYCWVALVLQMLYRKRIQRAQALSLRKDSFSHLSERSAATYSNVLLFKTFAAYVKKGACSAGGKKV